MSLTQHPAAGQPPGTSHIPTGAAFDALMAEVMAHADRFGHRQHIHLTWLAVRRYGTDAAITLVSEGIQRTARYVGAPQKYHATISRAWVELVGHHATGHHATGHHATGHHATGDDNTGVPAAEEFDAFADRYPALLDKRLLIRHYRPSTLTTAQARTGWVPPDLQPLPGARPPAQTPLPGPARAANVVDHAADSRGAAVTE